MAVARRQERRHPARV